MWPTCSGCSACSASSRSPRKRRSGRSGCPRPSSLSQTAPRHTAGCTRYRQRRHVLATKKERRIVRSNRSLHARALQLLSRARTNKGTLDVRSRSARSILYIIKNGLWVDGDEMARARAALSVTEVRGVCVCVCQKVAATAAHKNGRCVCACGASTRRRWPRRRGGAPWSRGPRRWPHCAI